MADATQQIDGAVLRIGGGALLPVRVILPVVNRRALELLIALDMLLIAAHVLSGMLLPQIPALLDLTREFSIAECIGYAKWLAIALVLVAAWRICRCRMLLPFAAVFAVMLAVDALQLHEGLGHVLSELGGATGLGGLPAKQAGEVMAFACLGLPLLPALAWGWLQADSAGRRIGGTLFGLIVVLALFGIVIDAAEPLFAVSRVAEAVTHLVEDGGEMLVASVILAHALAIRSAAQRAPRA